MMFSIPNFRGIEGTAREKVFLKPGIGVPGNRRRMGIIEPMI
jgi:hypothetical protein